MVGGMVNLASPNWFIITALVIVLSISGFKTLHKGYKTRIANKEKADTIRSMSQMELGDLEDKLKTTEDASPNMAGQETNLDGEFFEKTEEKTDEAGADDTAVPMYKVTKFSDEDQTKFQ